MQWLVAYRAVWIRTDREYRPEGGGDVTIVRSPAVNTISIIDADPAEWAVGLAADFRAFAKEPKVGQIVVDLIQIFSMTPLDGEAAAQRGGLGAILAALSANPCEWPQH